MSNTSDTPCDVVEQYNNYVPLHIVQGLQITFSTISIIVVWYTTVRYLKKSIFEQVFKELLYTLYFFILLHSIITIVLQGLLVFVRLTSIDSCQAQIDKLLCYTLRITTTIPLTAFVCIHLSITCNRMFTTFSSNTKIHKIAGRFMIIITFVYSISITGYAYAGEKFIGRVPYCTGATRGSEQVFKCNFIILFSFDVLNIVIDVFILKFNQYKLKNNKTFKLEETFRRQQNIYSIEQFLPSAVFHCLCYFVQVGGLLFGWTFRDKVSEVAFVTINAYIYFIPYYCAIGPAILLYLIKKGKLIRSENLRNVVVTIPYDTMNNVHFEGLENQWDHGLLIRKGKS